MILQRSTILYTIVIFVSFLLLLITGGCSGGDSSNNFHKLLELIPAETTYTQYTMTLIDHASYFADKNISLTKPDGELMTIKELFEMKKDDEVGRYSMVGFDITGYGQYAMAGMINEKYIGYNYSCVDVEMEAGAPPNNMVAAVGRFNPQATKDALSNQGDWPQSIQERYTLEEYNGVTIHSWGNGQEIDLTTVLAPPHLDQIGRARPLAVTDEYLFYAPTTDLVRSMIDASQNKTKSLADLPEFSSIADALFEMNTYVAIIGDEQFANGEPDYTGTYLGPKLKKFITFASGLGEDEKGSYMILVVYHENSSDAKANVSILEQRIEETNSISTERPWREIFTDTDISVEGNTLKAKLYTEYTGIWNYWLYNWDPILLHEK
jgi:hypothetical protein